VAAATTQASSHLAIKAGTTLAVLHGSNLGTCRALAKQLAEEATDMGCTATVAPLDDAASGLPESDAILIVASSYNGQPTDDARGFYDWIVDPGAELRDARYAAVLGVGDRNWADTYRAVPKRIDERLAELGAPRLVPRASADTSGDFTGTVEEFSATLWSALAEHFGDAGAMPVTSADEPLYELHPIVGPVTSAIDARFTVTPMTVLESTELVTADNSLGQAKRYVQVALPDDVEYHTGDHLTVLADNPPELVDEVIERFGIDPELRLSINARRSSRRLIALDREVSVRELLTHFVELRKPATRSQLRRLAAINPCLPERQRLAELAEASEPCALSPIECLLEFPACVVTGAELLELLEPMTPRHYSIASSSRLSPRTIALVVSVLDAPARAGLGLFKGVASNHLAAIGPGHQIRARVDQARQAFRAGADPTRTSSSSVRERASPRSAAFSATGWRPNKRARPSHRRCASSASAIPKWTHLPRAVRGGGGAWDRADAAGILARPAGRGPLRAGPDRRRRGRGLGAARRSGQECDWLIGLVESDHYVEDVWAG